MTKTTLRCLVVGLTCVLTVATAGARPSRQLLELVEPELEPDIVGDVDGSNPSPRKVLQDTVWIATWSFDTGAPCDDSGWTKTDNRILNDGMNYWGVVSNHDGSGGISGNAAGLGYVAQTCCVDANGYGNDWYQGLRITYSGPASLSFDYLLDSEPDFDFIRVESDSACASFARVDYGATPGKAAANYRRIHYETSGYDLSGVVANLALPDYGAGTHCAYITFFSDVAWSPCDGLQPTTIGNAIVIDDISITDQSGTRTENFGDGDLDHGWTFDNVKDSKPFGDWGRTFAHITDNDLCTENTTCAWLWTDHTTPTIANDPSMFFAPGGFVVRNWLDQIVVSPWVSLVTTPAAMGTVLQFRRFPGNFFGRSRIVATQRVRWKFDKDDGMGGTLDCVADWQHFGWSTTNAFSWLTGTVDLSAALDASAKDIQIAIRTSDWQWINAATPPSPFQPGPGPYLDRVRIGRRVLSGPILGAGRNQAQDCFPTEIHSGVTPAGEHHRPSTDRFGTCALSMSQDLGVRFSPNVITGDSITIFVDDARDAGGITAVEWYGVLAAGPHQGKAPAPYAVGANGFFSIAPDSSRFADGIVIAGDFFIDVDDTYFRGGDVLQYVWLARDAAGGVRSAPEGLTDAPTSPTAAQEATQGLFEVNFLPTINWDPGYLARIASDPHGDLDPTQTELDGSSQANCILYAQMVNLFRRSGDVNRTSFMYTLDKLGYRGHYDVWDVIGLGNSNNQLGGRASVVQAEGYNLIIYDIGNQPPSGWFMPDGSDLDTQKVDQAGWFRSWLGQASLSEASYATLWILGSNALEERPTNPLYATDMGVTLARRDQGLSLTPDVIGQGTFGFDTGSNVASRSFTTGRRAQFSLKGGCPTIRNYDGLGVSGSAVSVYRYRSPNNGSLGDGAIVMKSNPTENWNTILQSHPWFDIVEFSGGMPSSPEADDDLLATILSAVVPLDCQHGPNTTAVPDGQMSPIQTRTALHQNHPNPFNPTTTIRFDLARSGHMRLWLYDVAGRRVRTLLDGKREAGANQTVLWNGLDDAGQRVASGLYFYRLEVEDIAVTKKLVLLR